MERRQSPLITRQEPVPQPAPATYTIGTFSPVHINLEYRFWPFKCSTKTAHSLNAARVRTFGILLVTERNQPTEVEETAKKLRKNL